MIKAIVFDLGNVLIDFDHHIAAEKIARHSAKTAKEIFNLFFDSELTGLFEEGRISPEDFFSRLKAALGLNLNYQEFLPVWNEIFFISEKNRQVYNLTQKLKNKYKVALLSNINTLHYDFLRKNFPLFDQFHNLFLSFELKVKKPDPLIYRKVLETLKVLPQEVFYADDREDLIQKARQLGINGVVFSGIDKLKSDLLDYGISAN